VRRYPVQRLVSDVVSRRSGPALGTRTEPLPIIGQAARRHLTSVLRLDISPPALDIAERHYRYPAGTVHVTVANLDASRVPAAVGAQRLGAQTLAPVSLHLGGFGCSPDTIFIKVLYDSAFVDLRKAVRRAFELPGGPLNAVRALPYSAMAFANVVRFDVAGERPPRNVTVFGSATIDTMEIVRTDRVLSDEGTDVLARISLGRGAT
jgi:hypothetical protein